jgi:hypothetical protein
MIWCLISSRDNFTFSEKQKYIIFSVYLFVEKKRWQYFEVVCSKIYHILILLYFEEKVLVLHTGACHHKKEHWLYFVVFLAIQVWLVVVIICDYVSVTITIFWHSEFSFYFRHSHIHGPHHSHSYSGESHGHSHNANMEGKFLLQYFEFVTGQVMWI